ncbi:MAG: DoxX family protein, partial [Mangrovibacterium sp.]
MKILWKLARILLGLVFLFSGLVKGIDPLGSAYKFTDYFLAWGMESLEPLALPLAVMLIIAEFLTGTALITGILLPAFTRLALTLLVFFTGLTLYIALENPVSDCGCFGDALKLSNWQTFLKNLVLLIPAFVLFRLNRRFRRIPVSGFRMGTAGIMTLFVATLEIYSLNHLPLIDFRPYKEGTHIPTAMSIPR